MEKVKERKNTVLKAVAKAMVKRELSGWPPGCTGFAYQPVRPKAPHMVNGCDNKE